MAKDYESRSGRLGNNGRFTSPGLDATDEDWIAYRDLFFNDASHMRNSRLQDAALSYAYVLGRQWSEIDTEVTLDGVRGYVIRDMLNKNPLVEMPRPVTNHISIAVGIELSSIGKRELTANIHTDSRDPRVTIAAKHAKSILDHRLKVSQWPEIRELANFVDVVTGTVGLRTWWDTNEADMGIFGSPNAMMCNKCGAKLASDRIPRSALEKFPIRNMETIRELATAPDDEQEVQITHCPHCPAPYPLERYDVENEEDARTADMFGRPMGMELPKGTPEIEVVTPFEMYPQNGGAGIYPHNFKRIGIRTIRDLDWIFDRWPHLEGKVTPEDPYQLFRKHPILGEWQFSGNFSARYDKGVFDDHQFMYEFIEDPGSLKYPKGARVIMVGDEVAEIRELMQTATIEMDGEEPIQAEASIVNVAVSRYKIRLSEFYGYGLPHDLISPQDRVNGTDAQIIDWADRGGSPHVWIPEGMHVTGPEWLPSYGSGKFIRFSIDPTNPEIKKPVEFGGNFNPAALYQVRDRAVTDIQSLAGPAKFEMGEAPKNITTTGGLQLLGEAAERRRGPYERPLVEMYQKSWRALLQMLWVFRVEDEEYEVETAEGVLEKKMFNRTVLRGQTKVVIEKQGYFDKSFYLAQATREAQADRLYDLTSQAAKKKILEYRGLPTDVNEGENLQVDIAKEQYVDFVDKGIVPIVDESLDNFKIRYQVIGTHLMTPEGRQLERKYGWDRVKRAIAGWESALKQAELRDLKMQEMYGGRISPKDPKAAELYAQLVTAYLAEHDAWEQMQVPPTSEAMAGGALPPEPIPEPQMPPKPVFLPALKQDRILNQWLQLLTENPIRSDGIDQAGFMKYLEFRAYFDALRLLDRDQMMGLAPPAMPPGQGTLENPVVPGADQAIIPNPPNPPNPPNTGAL